MKAKAIKAKVEPIKTILSAGCMMFKRSRFGWCIWRVRGASHA